MIEGQAVPVRARKCGASAASSRADRIFHQKFATVTVRRVEDNKLAIAFETRPAEQDGDGQLRREELRTAMATRDYFSTDYREARGKFRMPPRGPGRPLRLRPIRR